jgi:inhibitor of KinA sporulation pathway (predicted exonuclease)
MRKAWTDLVIINGRSHHPETQSLIEHDNHTLEMALEKWMQYHHTNNWSKGKYMFMFITFHSFQQIFLSRFGSSCLCN